MGALLFNKAPTEVFVEYSNYSNIFLMENLADVPENFKINEHAIKLEKDKKPLLGFIYNLRLVKLETLKTYIKTNLANSFIRSFISPAGALILFDHKIDKSLWFYMDYQSLNNLIIKN